MINKKFKNGNNFNWFYFLQGKNGMNGRTKIHLLRFVCSLNKLVHIFILLLIISQWLISFLIIRFITKFLYNFPMTDLNFIIKFIIFKVGKVQTNIKCMVPQFHIWFFYVSLNRAMDQIAPSSIDRKGYIFLFELYFAYLHV